MMRSLWLVMSSGLALVATESVLAGEGDLAWAKRAGGTGSDFGWAIATLSDGSALVLEDAINTARARSGNKALPVAPRLQNQADINI